MTLREWLDRGEALLSEGPHSDHARRDAEMLLLHKIGKNRAWLIAHSDEEFAGCSAISYSALLERRLRGEPIQYITGECEFYGLPFRVTPDVLIPRPETEHLVEKVLDFSKHLGASGLLPLETWHTNRSDRRLRILDVGTGSGAIAIALASQLPTAIVTAIDISDAALAVAQHNAARNQVLDRIRFLEGDLLTPVASEQFEIIASNPPYVPSSDHALIAVEVREHEPHVALFGGDDGFAIFRRLVPAAFDALVSGGYLAFEFGFSQQPDLESLLASAGFEQIGFVHDLQGIPRVASARRP